MKSLDMLLIEEKVREALKADGIDPTDVEEYLNHELGLRAMEPIDSPLEVTLAVVVDDFLSFLRYNTAMVTHDEYRRIYAQAKADTSQRDVQEED